MAVDVKAAFEPVDAATDWLLSRADYDEPYDLDAFSDDDCAVPST